ncbi:hydrolase [Anaerovorax odorimutans]|uniref:hydrolase n=1 Tax=Anaerovorax odorimutans TaxID=109327 RepID=UPI0003F93CA8|nr:hydrolase [Anaerovorax odorimutans]
MKTLKIKKEDAVFVGIDFQDRIMPAMKNNEELEETVIKLIKGCRIMGIPIIMTQQYTKGLGDTKEKIIEALTEPIEENSERLEFLPIEKTNFSAMGEPAFVEALEKLKRKTVIIGGIEAHVCVQQTVLDLIESGYSVFLVNDCISSRSNNDKKYAQRRMGESGAMGTTYESVLFELCQGAKEPGFKQISKIVK